MRIVYDMETETRTPQPGDRCVILGGGRVQHYDCDEHRNGTITDVRTGEVLSTR